MSWEGLEGREIRQRPGRREIEATLREAGRDPHDHRRDESGRSQDRIVPPWPRAAGLGGLRQRGSGLVEYGITTSKAYVWVHVQKLRPKLTYRHIGFDQPRHYGAAVRRLTANVLLRRKRLLS